MSTWLNDWRETLEDLGVMGLVRLPVDTPPPQPVDPIPHTPFTPLMAPAPWKPIPEPTIPVPPPPTDPASLPDPQTVAECPGLEDLDRLIQACLACPLGSGRFRFVFGEGHPRAELMFIGEGPGRDEDLQGRPFVGKAGELLDKMILAMGFTREQVYIANVVKCRPPDNRTPTREEAAHCLPYLHRQIELIRPKVIVTLGATPLRELMGITTGITRIRGQWQRLEMLGGIPVMPTFHPAYVLRQYTPEVRKAVWGDLQKARDWLRQA